MERSVLVMLSDRSSAPTLLGCRPSARQRLGRSQNRFQLLTKSSSMSSSELLELSSKVCSFKFSLFSHSSSYSSRFSSVIISLLFGTFIISISLTVALTINVLNMGNTHQNNNPPIDMATPKIIPSLANHAPHAPNFRSNQSQTRLSLSFAVTSSSLFLF